MRGKQTNRVPQVATVTVSLGPMVMVTRTIGLPCEHRSRTEQLLREEMMAAVHAEATRLVPLLRATCTSVTTMTSMRPKARTCMATRRAGRRLEGGRAGAAVDPGCRGTSKDTTGVKMKMRARVRDSKTVDGQAREQLCDDGATRRTPAPQTALPAAATVRRVL